MYGTYYSRTVVTPRLLSLDPHFLDSPRILLSLTTAVCVNYLRMIHDCHDVMFKNDVMTQVVYVNPFSFPRPKERKVKGRLCQTKSYPHYGFHEGDMLMIAIIPNFNNHIHNYYQTTPTRCILTSKNMTDIHQYPPTPAEEWLPVVQSKSI